MSQRDYNGLEIAVVGMACRFPKSPNVGEFWKNLVAGKECITIDATGDDNLIKAKGILEDNECFDFDFFNYSPNEAEYLDPQVRVLHECTWEALEDAGCNPFQYEGLIGNYVGASTNPTSYIQPFLRRYKAKHELWSNLLYSDKDFISTRISYKLNLKGPSVTVDTACSTSLAAIDMACQGLLTGKCDVAVAGGVSITYHDENGYVYKEGFISSPDGHCRAFDENAKGTVTGNGAGIVVLKRLEDALRDGDRIDAVILGSSVNNDGITKQGYTAPSREGQINVIKSALKIAEISPESIGYVEAHGTGTEIGDPIEIDALKIAFASAKRNYCAIGAVKTNIGHLDAAAGVAGFIKAVLVLKHRQIPPTLHFKKPNPKFDLRNSPFYINSSAIDWVDEHKKKRAAVSSFGMGGTNIHVILEEAPDRETHNRDKGDVFLFSARTKKQLEVLKKNFIDYCRSERSDPLEFNNIAHTLRTGRQQFKYRLAIQADSFGELDRKLNNKNIEDIRSSNPMGGKRVFMFSGQGSQYINMTKHLYDNNLFYRTELDRCFQILNDISGRDIKSVLFNDSGLNTSEINETVYTQPILVAVEYALAKLLIHCGLEPDVVIGHSIGEYTAACISGVFSLEDTLKIVSKRALLMSSVERGGMIAVAAGRGELCDIIPEGVSLAAENSYRQIVVSGPFPALSSLKNILEERKLSFTELHVSHAFHSDMMQSIKRELEDCISEASINRPSVCYISNLTGKVVSDYELASPEYWSNQMTSTVLFKECILSAVAEGGTQFFEIGPGLTLQNFTASTVNDVQTLGFVRHINAAVNDCDYFFQKLATLWERGNNVKWESCFTSINRRKVSLPTYPFERTIIPVRRIDFDNISDTGVAKNISETGSLRYYVPVWTQSLLSRKSAMESTASCVLFSFDIQNDSKLIHRVKSHHPGLIVVELASINKETDDYVTIDKADKAQYGRIIEKAEVSGNGEIKVILCCGGSDRFPDNITCYTELQSFLFLTSSLAASDKFETKYIYAITNNLYDVLNEEVNVSSSPLVGALKIVPVEHQEMQCANIDIDYLELSKEDNNLLDCVYGEIARVPKDIVVAYRRGIRWVPDFQEVVPESECKKLKYQGTYIVTGGLGGMAYTIATHLLKTYRANVVIVGRSGFLNTIDWNSTDSPGSDIDLKYQNRIEDLSRIVASGSGSVVSYGADISDQSDVQRIIDKSIAVNGSVNGIFHTAGIVDYGGVMQRRDMDSFRLVMSAKVEGVNNLIEAINKSNQKIDFCLLFSSNGNVLHASKYGQSAYTAANEYLDALAFGKNVIRNLNIKTINWNDWYEVGMTVDSLTDKFGMLSEQNLQTKIDDGISPQQGIDIIEKVLGSSFLRVIVSRKDLKKEVACMNDLLLNNKAVLWNKLAQHTSSNANLYKKPELETQYQAPRNKVEEIIIDELRNYLKYEDIGVYDNFFELGLSSLDLVQISNRLTEKLESSVSVTVLFTYPTVDALATRLSHAEGETINVNVAEAAAMDESTDLQNSLKLFE